MKAAAGGFHAVEGAAHVAEGTVDAVAAGRELESLQVGQGRRGVVEVSLPRAIGESPDSGVVLRAGGYSLNELAEHHFALPADQKVEQPAIGSLGDLPVHQSRVIAAKSHRDAAIPPFADSGDPPGAVVLEAHGAQPDELRAGAFELPRHGPGDVPPADPQIHDPDVRGEILDVAGDRAQSQIGYIQKPVEAACRVRHGHEEDLQPSGALGGLGLHDACNSILLKKICTEWSGWLREPNRGTVATPRL